MIGGSTRALLAHLCDTIRACPLIMEHLDPVHGIRRMQWGLEEPWQNVLTYGRVLYRRRDPFARRPIYVVSVSFAPWIRGEAAATTMGDLILADIADALIYLFDQNRPVPDTCDDFILLDSMFDDFSTEAAFDDTKQAWTQIHRFRFDVIVPSCVAPAENCFGTCP
jgi:hypothetical protein